MTKKKSKIYGLKTLFGIQTVPVPMKLIFFLANIVFEPVKIYTDKIGCTLGKFGLKCLTSQNNIFIMQLPGEFSPFIEKKWFFA